MSINKPVLFAIEKDYCSFPSWKQPIMFYYFIARLVTAKTHRKASHYWNCDEFETGESYDIKNGHVAVIHGTASFTRSPIDSGFHLQVSKFGIYNKKICILWVIIYNYYD